MNFTPLQKPVTAAVNWLKKLPKAISISLAFGGLLLLFALFEAVPHRHASTSAAIASVASSAPRAAAMVVQQAAPPGVAPAPVQAVSTTPLQVAPATPAAAPAAQIAPPAGLVEGQVVVTIYNADAFGKYAPLSTRAVGSVRTSWQSYTGPANSPAWRETITGWFQLSSPATVETLRRGNGAAADLVTGEIDGASLGRALHGPSSEMAAFPLAAGWHSFRVTAANGSLGYLATATAIELAVGNGVDTPMPVVPWAVVSSQAASAVLPAPSASAAAATPKARTPAPASTAVPAKTHRGDSIPAGAKQ